MKPMFLVLLIVFTLPIAESLSPRAANGPPDNHGLLFHRCSYCHNTHQAKGAALIREQVLENVCRRCHNGAQISQWMQQGLFSKPQTNISPAFPNDPQYPLVPFSLESIR